ncbi:type II secretion system F family protein [Campylobacter sp. MIT 21-1685]|uniref:type II secretion system F family protein n=1 Tax=unclassified Campylobacter TaxID=2593542 RepID=UPI00224B6A30|nr:MULTISPECIES: type II secretion system F family protein [unclassified Campylobacter]MCX2683244.1 type II secretion system F family protein [Campylobacter sp. MIT 21-1684]MCX2751563.1 type II secretion system F family protein [Campylobacter sp. MIT 21-1682]MCX2807762.1 type II secretion system F family protein [Campylobacter sp. MIT 21-1685]
MKLYELEYIKKDIKLTKIIKAPNINVAQAKAFKHNIHIISLKEIKKNRQRKISDENFILFFKELALLSEVGLSVAQALKELQSTHTIFSSFLIRLNENLDLGHNLSKAFENSYLSLHYSELALIKMAENTGEISKVFTQIATLRTKRLQNEKALKKALRYPLIVFVSVCCAFSFLMLFVVPNFSDLFESFGADLPLITRIMLASYESLNAYFFILVWFLFTLIFICIVSYKKSYIFALFWDSILLKIPFFGQSILYNQKHSFFLVFSLLLKSGIPLSKAFELANASIKNKALYIQFSKLSSSLTQGLEFSLAFKKTGLFDGVVLSMLALAMKSGKLELLSEEIAKYYQQKQEALMEKFLSLIEPFMTLLVGILVLFLALGIFLPMWELGAVSNL